MVRFILVQGRKGENDVLVEVYAQGEVLSFSEVLFLLDKYFQSEEDYYPKPKYEGSTMLMKAVLEIYSGIPFETVLEKYGLSRKTRKLDVEDKRRKMKG